MKKQLTLLAAFTVAAVTSQAALVAHWDFEGDTQEAITSTAGTLTGDAAVGGTAIAPTGSGSLTTTTGHLNTGMNANAITGFGGTGSFSILSWVQTTSTANQTIFNYSPSNGGTGGGDLRFFVQGNGNMRVEMSAGAGFELDLGALNLNDGSTHMVGVLFDSGTGDSFQDLDLYVDGTLYNVAGGTDHTVNILGSGTPPNILIGLDQTTKQFVGTIDDMAIFDTALTSGELADFAANGIPEPATLGLVAMFGGGVLFIRRRMMI